MSAEEVAAEKERRKKGAFADEKAAYDCDGENLPA